MKRITKALATILALVLCVCMMPVTAVAATADQIVINNQDIVTAPNNTVQCGEGNAVYDPQTKTLTLNQAEITVGTKASSNAAERYGIAVKAESIDTLEIVLNGENKINLSDTQYNNSGIWSTKSALKFSGEGSMSISLYNDYWPHAIHAQGYGIEFNGVDIVCKQLNDAHKGYAILSTKTVTATNTSFEINGFEAGIDAGVFVMKDSSLKVANSADWGMAVFADGMTIENSIVDAQVLDTGLYCLGDMTVNASTVNCSEAYVGVYADSGNIVIKGSSKLNLQNRTYGLRIYNGKLTVSDGIIHAVGKENSGGISVLNEKGNNTEPPADAITLADNLTEKNGGKLATVETMWDNGWDEPYPVYITSFIPNEDSALNTNLSNALVTVNIELKEADYTDVNKAIEAAGKLNKEDYKDFSAVEAAVAAVVYGKKITEQTEVDAMAKTINDAIAILEKKDVNTVICEHEYTEQKNNSDEHWNVCAKCGLEQSGSREAHKGGTATCTAKAKCEACKTEYGEMSDHKYEWVIDKEPTDAEDGSKHEECTVCKAKRSVNTAIPKTETKSPKTEDNSNIMLWVALLFISGVGIVATTVIGRKRRTN